MAEAATLDLRKTVGLARDEARAQGSARIEAEHLLLALAAQSQLPAGRLLCGEGLRPDAIRQALDLEFAHSLGAIGISLHGFALPDTRLPVLGSVPMGRSAKLAWQRAIRARSGRGRDRRRLDSLHLLIGILAAQSGTVARALTISGFDRDALAERARHELEERAA